MKFSYEQPDGSVFLGRCRPRWNTFNLYHDVVHDLATELAENEHLVTCQRCSGRGYARNKTVGD